MTNSATIKKTTRSNLGPTGVDVGQILKCTSCTHSYNTENTAL